MGFYIEMSQTEPQVGLFEERGVPSTFWVLYGIALFAVLCMGMAAFTVLRDLFQRGNTFDQVLLFGVFSFIPAILLIGMKLALFRKFIEFSGDHLIVGFRSPNRKISLFKNSFPKKSVTDFFLINKRQSANLAKKEHEDRRYHIRGHWKVLAEVNGKRIVLDRHTEQEALEPLYQSLKAWLGK